MAKADIPQTDAQPDAVAPTVAVKRLKTPTHDIEAEAGRIQARHAREHKDDPDFRPLTGVEIAKEINAIQPLPPAPGSRYLIKQRTNPNDDGVKVVSADGSIEDAVRAYNANRVDLRTAKQLIIELVG